MEIGKKNIGTVSCTSGQLYKYYFNIVNGLLGLSNKEIDIVARLYYYNSIISKDVINEKLVGTLLFSKDYKSKIVKDLEIKPLLLNNYIANLKKKGIILVDKDGFKWLNPKHTLELDKDAIQIIFNLKKTEEDEHQEEQVVEETNEEPREEAITEEEDITVPKAEIPEFDANDPWGEK